MKGYAIRRDGVIGQIRILLKSAKTTIMTTIMTMIMTTIMMSTRFLLTRFLSIGILEIVVHLVVTICGMFVEDGPNHIIVPLR